MTLLEAIVAMVILSMVGVGCLELAHGASQLQSNSVQWNSAISEAESRMATATIGAPTTASSRVDEANGAPATTVTRTPWRDGLDEIAVTVAIDGSRSFTLRRLVPSARGSR